MSAFENSWESLDKARNTELYETQKLADGREVTFLRTSDSNEVKTNEVRQVFTREEEENITKAAEKMNDRED